MTARPTAGLLAALLAAPLLSAAPPEVPSEVRVKPGQLVRVSVKADAELGTLKNFKDEEAFWGELVSPKGVRQFVFQAPQVEYKDGKPLPQRAQYVIGWWAKGETEGVTTTIIVEGATGEPPPGDDGKNPPPPPTSGVYYFMVIRPDGAADPTFTKVMADPGWGQLKAKGHTIKDFTRTAAAPWATLPADMPYGVVTLETAGGKSVVVRPAVALPTVTAAILKLPEGVR